MILDILCLLGRYFLMFIGMTLLNMATCVLCFSIPLTIFLHFREIIEIIHKLFFRNFWGQLFGISLFGLAYISKIPNIQTIGLLFLVLLYMNCSTPPDQYLPRIVRQN